MKRLGGFTRRYRRHTGEDLAGSIFPNFDPPREDIVGGGSGVEGTTQKTSEGVGGIAPGISSSEVSDKVEQRLDWYLDQLHISEGCPHNKER